MKPLLVSSVPGSGLHFTQELCRKVMGYKLATDYHNPSRARPPNSRMWALHPYQFNDGQRVFEKVVIPMRSPETVMLTRHNRSHGSIEEMVEAWKMQIALAECHEPFFLMIEEYKSVIARITAMWRLSYYLDFMPDRRDVSIWAQNWTPAGSQASHLKAERPSRIPDSDRGKLQFAQDFYDARKSEIK